MILKLIPVCRDDIALSEMKEKKYYLKKLLILEKREEKRQTTQYANGKYQQMSQQKLFDKLVTLLCVNKNVNSNKSIELKWARQTERNGNELKYHSINQQNKPSCSKSRKQIMIRAILAECWYDLLERHHLAVNSNTIQQSANRLLLNSAAHIRWHAAYEVVQSAYSNSFQWNAFSLNHTYTHGRGPAVISHGMCRAEPSTVQASTWQRTEESLIFATKSKLQLD